jgi:hypothetical protein
VRRPAGQGHKDRVHRQAVGCVPRGAFCAPGPLHECGPQGAAAASHQACVGRPAQPNPSPRPAPPPPTPFAPSTHVCPGKRLLQLINDILDAAKMKQGTLLIKHEKASGAAWCARLCPYVCVCMACAVCRVVSCRNPCSNTVSTMPRLLVSRLNVSRGVGHQLHLS